MKTYSNILSSDWVEVLEDEKSLRKYLPMSSFLLINNSSLLAKIYLNNDWVGNCEPYSPFSVVGRVYDQFRVVNEQGKSFNANELIVVVAKDTSVSAMPLNPQLELMEDNLDVYVSGCDNRISFGGGITANDIKYWVNVQSDLIAQRRIEFEGTAAMGQYEITFSSVDTVDGSVGINNVTTLEKRIKKTIANQEFDLSLTNCLLAGWIIDLKLRTDIMDSFITVSNPTGGDTTKINDDLLNTYCQITNAISSDALVLDLGELKAVKEIHHKIYYYEQYTTNSGSILISPDGSNWTLIETFAGTGLNYIHDVDNVSIRYIKYCMTTTNPNSHMKIYECTIVE